MFGLLADVEGFHRPMIAHYPRPDFTRLTFGIIKTDLFVMCFVILHSFTPFIVG